MKLEKAEEEGPIFAEEEGPILDFRKEKKRHLSF